MKSNHSGSARTAVVVIALAARLFSGGPARGALPPITEAQIDAESDLVVVVDVLGVACQSVEPWAIHYGAWVRVREVVRGEMEINQTFVLDFMKLGPQSGGVEMLMHPGQRLKLLLRTESGKAEAWHPDGCKILVDVPRGAHVLPHKAGNAMFAGQLANDASPQQGRIRPGR